MTTWPLVVNQTESDLWVVLIELILTLIDKSVNQNKVGYL